MDRARTVELDDRVTMVNSRERSGLKIIVDFSPNAAADQEFVLAVMRGVALWEELIRTEMLVRVRVALDPEDLQYPVIAGGYMSDVYPLDREPTLEALRDRAFPETRALFDATTGDTIAFSADSGYTTTLRWRATRAEQKLMRHITPIDTSELEGLVFFNSNYAFDNDVADGVDADTLPTERVVIHMLGHILGFNTRGSRSGSFTTLDLFRYGIGEAGNNPTSLEDLSDLSITRECRTGVAAALDTVGAVEGYEGRSFLFSTGTSSVTNSHGHWKPMANASLSVPIGMMDQDFYKTELALPPGYFTDADRLAMRLIGWRVTLPDAPACRADLTTTHANPGDASYGVSDGDLDGADLSYYIERYLYGKSNPDRIDMTTKATNPGDAGYGAPDGVVDGADLAFFVEQWITGCD